MLRFRRNLPLKERKMRKKTIELFVLLVSVAAVCGAGSREIRIAMHLQPELPIDGTENMYVGPILI